MLGDASQATIGNQPYVWGYRVPVPLNMAQVKQAIGYPSKAIQEGKEGYVHARILVDKHGKYLEHAILDATDPVFLIPVNQHLHKMKFLPGIREAAHSEYWIRIPFNFAFEKHWMEGN